MSFRVCHLTLKRISVVSNRIPVSSPGLSRRPRELGHRAITIGGPGRALPSASKPRNIRERNAPAAHMHVTEFGAPGQRRENLAGVEQALVVKRAFQAMLLVEIEL